VFREILAVISACRWATAFPRSARRKPRHLPTWQSRAPRSHDHRGARRTSAAPPIGSLQSRVQFRYSRGHVPCRPTARRGAATYDEDRTAARHGYPSCALRPSPSSALFWTQVPTKHAYFVQVLGSPGGGLGAFLFAWGHPHASRAIPYRWPYARIITRRRWYDRPRGWRRRRRPGIRHRFCSGDRPGGCRCRSDRPRISRPGTRRTIPCRRWLWSDRRCAGHRLRCTSN